MAGKPGANQLDLFVLPLSDVDLRDQQDTMEHPFFALNKGRKTPLEFGNPKGNVYVNVSPNVSHGMATIWDADILLWAASTINRMQRQKDVKALAELEHTRTLHFHPIDLLRAIKRGTGGRDIQELRAALERLTSTYVTTNIREHHQHGPKNRGFHWLGGWTELKSKTNNGKERTIGLMITLSEWFYRGIIDQRSVLAIEPEYFNLSGGYERWLWRVARKHAHGAPGGWSFTLTTLHQKSGSEAPKKAFKRDLKRLAEKGNILGYGIEWQERGRGEDPIIRLYPNLDHERNQKLAAVHEKRTTKKVAVKALQAEPDRFRDLLSPRALTSIVARYPDIDLEDMMNRFMRWNTERGTTPRNVARAFDGFIRTHQNRQR